MRRFSCLAHHPTQDAMAGVSVEAPDPDEANMCFFHMLNSFYVTGLYDPFPILGHDKAGHYVFTWIDSKGTSDHVRFATIEASNAEDAIIRLQTLAEDGVLIVPAEPC